MDASTIFAAASALIADGATPSRDAVDAALQQCASLKEMADREITRLAAERPNILVAGSDSMLAQHDDASAAATRTRDRAEAIGARLRERLAVIDAAAAAAERAARRDEVEAQCSQAADALRKRYPKLITELRAILKAVATAQDGCARFAKSYPDEPAIPDPEMSVRTPRSIEDEIVSETTVWRWIHINGAPLDERYYASVHEQHRRGQFSGIEILDAIAAGTYKGDRAATFECRGDLVRAVRMTRREVIRQERVRSPAELACAAVLPGFFANEAGWDGNAYFFRAPTAVLAKLDELDKPAPQRAPRPIFEYLAIESAEVTSAQHAQRRKAHQAELAQARRDQDRRQRAS